MNPQPSKLASLSSVGRDSGDSVGARCHREVTHRSEPCRTGLAHVQRALQVWLIGDAGLDVWLLDVRVHVKHNARTVIDGVPLPHARTVSPRQSPSSTHLSVIFRCPSAQLYSLMIGSTSTFRSGAVSAPAMAIVVPRSLGSRSLHSDLGNYEANNSATISPFV